jgi:hypothetical protein
LASINIFPHPEEYDDGGIELGDFYTDGVLDVGGERSDYTMTTITSQRILRFDRRDSQREAVY